MEAIETTVTNPLVESEVVGKAVKKSGKRIGYNYIILKSLKESQKNDVIRCLYIKSLTNFGVCVIKEGGYGDSKDKQGRDIKDRLQWQKQLHESLQDKVRLPRLLGSFEENGNYYLVLERIRGKSLHKTCREYGKDLREGLIAGNKVGLKFLGYMAQITELLEKLHQQQIVHRDVTATNFMINPAGQVAIIDMELSYSLEKTLPYPPFQLGTYGYMSPEQESMHDPAYEQDVYSVGVILLQMWTGIWPTKLTNGTYSRLIDRINFFIPDEGFSNIVKACLDPEPKLRPELNQVRKSINTYSDELIKKVSRKASPKQFFTKVEILQTVEQFIGTLSSPLLTDDQKGWFSENTGIPTHEDKRKINKAWYASVQRGSCGIIYFLSKANKAGIDITVTRPYIEKGIELIEERYISKMDNATPGLYYGGAGIAAVLAIATREGIIEPQTRYFDWMNRLLELNNDSLGIQHGLAGQGIAHWLCHPFLHPEKVQHRLSAYVHKLLEAQQKDGSWSRSEIEGNKGKKIRITRGFAHGVAGIVYFLLEYASLNKNEEALTSALKGLQWLIKKSVKGKTSINWRSSEDKELGPWWCEGAAGISLTFLKAYTVTKEEKFKEFVVGALANHNQQAIANNLSQCHGLSGLGEIYLEAFDVLQNEEYLERAEWITQVLMHLKLIHPDHGPYWLVENERQPIADFMVGSSGVVHYLLRHCYKDKIRFPMLY